MTEESIVVACVADDAYAMPLAVTLKSAAKNLEAGRTLEVHVVDGGISEDAKNQLVRSLLSDPVSVRWTASDRSRLVDLPLWGRMSINTYQRLLVDDLLPSDVQRVIWLDSDLVVKGDLARLWDLAMEGNHLLAVRDMLVPFVSSSLGVRRFREHGLDPHAKYFNAGVLVIDLDRWRADEIGRQAIAHLRIYGREVLLWDQEALNVVLVDKWGELDPRWNQNASISGRPFFRQSHLDPFTYQQVVSDPWVVHFNGHLKPWLCYGDTPLRALFFSYLDMTAWVGWRPPCTFRTVLMGMYESSTLRRVLYPLEEQLLRCWRVLTRVSTPDVSSAQIPER